MNENKVKYFIVSGEIDYERFGIVTKKYVHSLVVAIKNKRIK